jgi:1-deoxy-D-xylulose-5-phosphate reductoisomerase
MSLVKNIAILGVTGSIGASTRDVILSAPERFDVLVVTANNNAEALALDALALKAKVAVIGDEKQYATLKEFLSGTHIEVQAGREALVTAVPTGTDVCVSAITGMAGLEPLLNAIKNSKCVGVANKEPLVAAGALVKAMAEKSGCRILPIDSEHNAVFQVFDFQRPEGIEKIILTASGGPFRTWSLSQMAAATPKQALAHPTWSMGQKISIDSATMMNKALEIIEAHVLFQMPAEKIEVLIHPQSVVHSMVEYADGSVLAQMGASDMRTPIAHVLAFPERMKTPGKTLNFRTLKTLDFEQPDFERFPALKLAYQCLKEGGTAALSMNAANEVAVEAYLAGRADFLGIIRTVEYALGCKPQADLDDIHSIIEADRVVRKSAKEYIERNPGHSAPKTKAIST